MRSCAPAGTTDRVGRLPNHGTRGGFRRLAVPPSVPVRSRRLAPPQPLADPTRQFAGPRSERMNSEHQTRLRDFVRSDFRVTGNDSRHTESPTIRNRHPTGVTSEHLRGPDAFPNVRDNRNTLASGDDRQFEELNRIGPAPCLPHDPTGPPQPDADTDSIRGSAPCKGTGNTCRA